MTTKQLLEKNAIQLFDKELDTCDKNEVFDILMLTTKELMQEKEEIDGDKKVYYFSAEFLIGKLLSNNLLNLGIREDVSEILESLDMSLSELEELEHEPSLGNGGLGRLAACFLDSIATLNLNGDGIGLNYHLGLFKQHFNNYKQCEEPNEWITPLSWLTKSDKRYLVEFKDFYLKASLYDLDVIGYQTGKNKLHLFDLESVSEKIVKEGISFDKENILKNLTLFLYPDDSDHNGQLLRLYQQYFMVSCGAQLILDELEERGFDYKDMDQHVVIQINDTHPSLVIPEMIRLLVNKGLTIDEAIELVSKTCAYTNHTILAEALEKWNLKDLEEIIPHIVPIIMELDMRAKEISDDEKVAIIDEDDRVHMAHMDIHYGFSINGVAAIHTDILKENELNHFYKLYPSKFNNKTNGITFRRWLLSCNKELTDFIDSLIGEGYKKDADELEKLLKYVDDEKVLSQLIEIKALKKKELCAYILEHEDITLDPDSVFDIQIKRLHEYKRQQMNVLYIIHQYLKIKGGYVPKRPLTCLFGAKAAPAYTIAKDIIHVILLLQNMINNDPKVSPYLKVVMVENYNVTYAEKLIPACDISEQISLASKEASGTGNMKFMLNGAITLGTDDGANVEIHDLVGDENIYIFGVDSDTVIQHYEEADYDPATIYEEDEHIQELVDFIISEEMMEYGDKESLTRIHKELTTKDWFMTLLDLNDYIETKDQAISDTVNTKEWAKKMLVNIGKAGYFSSDRTIGDYNEDIWKLR